MNRLYLYFFLILTVSCGHLRQIEKQCINGSSIYFSKVKVTFNSNENRLLTLRGYISILKDSLICFKFFGPLSYEVLSGYIDKNQYRIFDSYNKKLYSSYDSTFSQFNMVRFNEGLFESFILGKRSDFVDYSYSLNKGTIIDTTRLFNNELSISDGSNRLKIKWSRNSFRVTSIDLKYSGGGSYFIKIDLIAVSRERKDCKFRF